MKISELMDHIQDDTVELTPRKTVSTERVTELTLDRVRANRKPVRRWKKLLIAACLVVALALGGAYAAEQIGASEYHTAVDYIHSYTMGSLMVRLKVGDITFPKKLDDFTFNCANVYHVVPDGIEYNEAAQNAVYESMAFNYHKADKHDVDENGWRSPSNQIDIDIGSMENPLWSQCYGYDPETLTFDPEGVWGNTAWDDFNTMEYKGYTVYYFETENDDGSLPDNWPKSFHATWLDMEQQVCYFVHTYFGCSAEEELVPEECLPGDYMPYVKLIIDYCCTCN